MRLVLGLALLGCQSPRPSVDNSWVTEVRTAADEMCRCADPTCRAQVHDRFDRRLGEIGVTIPVDHAVAFDREFKRYSSCASGSSHR